MSGVRLRGSWLWLSMIVACLAVTPARADDVTIVLGGELQPGEQLPAADHVRFPFGMEFDEQGSLFVVEYALGGRVWMVAPDGTASVVAGNGKQGFAGDGGPPLSAEFHDLHNLAIAPDGRIFMSDHQNHRVRQFDVSGGSVTTFAGTGEKGFSGDGGPASAAQLNQVMCVTLSHNRQHLLITDLSNRRIRRVELSAGIITTVAGNGERGVPENGSLAATSPLFDPRAAAEDSQGRLYILERGGHALRRVAVDGTISTVAGTGKKGRLDGPALAATFNGPKHLAIGPRDEVYIADDENHLIRCYDPQSEQVSTVLGQHDTKLNRPHGVMVHDGRLFIADSWNHRVLSTPLP